MIVICNGSRKGSWLSANQIWITKRFFIICSGSYEMLIINPVILEAKWRKNGPEWCLSKELHDVQMITRNTELRLKFEDWNWNEKIHYFRGIDAVIIQHEMDHLNWIVV